MTNGELVSMVMVDGNFLNKDDSIPRRHVLNVARTKATTYMAHKLTDNTLYEEDNLFSVLDCFKMKKVSSMSCGIPALSTCNTMCKSVNKLPTLLNSKQGNSIVSVTTIDELNPLKPLNASQFGNSQKRQYANVFSDINYFVKGGYLYTTDCLDAVNVCLISLYAEEVAEANGDNDCEDCDKCKSLWDHEFIVSDKILEIVVSETIDSIIRYIKGTPVDENPNLDSNQKSRTVN